MSSDVPLAPLSPQPSPTPYTDDPDAPLLTSTPTQPRLPKWLLPTPKFRRPRFTLRNALILLVTLYILYCLVRGMPLFASPLPSYSGPHAVGLIDIEAPLPAANISATTFKDGTPAFELESVLFSLYYPASSTTRAHHYWIERPVSLTAKGYAAFAHADNVIVRALFTFSLWLIAGGITIPASVDAPVSDGVFPVMVFSHGMASSRTDYTHYAGELASRGYVVALVEHRDGSCPGTAITLPSGKRQLVHFKEADLVANGTKISTPQLKEEQLAFRQAEVTAAAHVLASINDGDEQRNTREGDLAAFRSRFDIAEGFVIGGHSYGATLALQALSDGLFKAGIALDPGKESGPLNNEISSPLLVVHSNSWSKTVSLFFGRPHFDTVKTLVKNVLERTGAAWFFTSLGTSHPSVSDAPLIEPFLLSWTTGARMNTLEGLQEYVRITVDFLAFVDTGDSQGLLSQPVTHEKYGEWISKERRTQFPKNLERLWEVHVSPATGD